MNSDGQSYKPGTKRARINSYFKNAYTRYLLVGVWNSIFGITIFFVLSFLFSSLNDLALLTFSYTFSIVQSHWTQRNLVWKSRKGYGSELLRFSTAYLGQYVINILLLSISGKIWELSREARQLFIIILLSIAFFFINKRGVFRRYD